MEGPPPPPTARRLSDGRSWSSGRSFLDREVCQLEEVGQPSMTGIIKFSRALMPLAYLLISEKIHLPCWMHG